MRDSKARAGADETNKWSRPHDFRAAYGTASMHLAWTQQPQAVRLSLIFLLGLPNILPKMPAFGYLGWDQAGDGFLIQGGLAS